MNVPAQQRELIDPAGTKVRARRRLSKLLGLDIQVLVKYGRIGGQYTLCLTDGRIVSVGKADSMLSQSRFRSAVADTLDSPPPKLTRKKWDQAVDAMCQLIEVVEPQADSARRISQGR